MLKRCPFFSISYMIGPAVVCRQPSHRGFCHGEFKRWYHDIKTRQCLEFTFSGCYGNENNFQSKEKCDEFCSGKFPLSIIYDK